MYTGIAPLLPVIVYCCQRVVVAVRLPDGRIGATLQSLCEALSLARHGQLERIRRNRMLNKQLLLVPIVTEGGWQQMDVLVSWAIPIWLGGINLTRLSPEKEELVLAFQDQIVDVLDRYFAEHDAEPAPPPRPERSDNVPRSALGLWRESVQLAGEALELLEEEQRGYFEDYQAMATRHAAFEERQSAFQQRQTIFEERQVIFEEVQEAMGEHLVETRERLARLEGREPSRPGTAKRQQPAANHAPPSGPLLSKDHRDHAYALARAERSRSGQRIDTTLRELAEAFGVEDVSDLPDALWDEALSWFWQRA